jgi:magnesium-transporting ATPase (P-type)
LMRQLFTPSMMQLQLVIIALLSYLFSCIVRSRTSLFRPARMKVVASAGLLSVSFLGLLTIVITHQAYTEKALAFLLVVPLVLFGGLYILYSVVQNAVSRRLSTKR